MFIQGRLILDPAAPPTPGWLRIEGGVIAELGEGEPPRACLPPALGGPDCVVSPAFFDAHCHLPQTDSVGVDGLTLLDWLNAAIFPAETWWGRGAAVAMAMTAARRHMLQGTVGVAAYLTSHGEVNREVLGVLAARTPMRFHAGRVGMDRLAPQPLIAEDLDRARQRPPRPCVLPQLGSDPRRRVSANPRFAITCTDELLAEFGWFAKANPGVFVQTHLSESVEECAKVRELFPRDASYTHVYDRFGLLHRRTLLAHAIHLSDDEWRLIAQRGSIAVHCPTANIFLQAGLFNLDKAREHSVRVALGSDIAGGPDAAMPRVARAMIETAKVRKLTRRAGDPPVRVPTPAEAWDLITHGNAEVLGWSDAGRLTVGAAADLLVLRPPQAWLDQHIIGRLIYNWDASLIEARVFEGRVWECDK